MNSINNKKDKGFTLIELMITLSIASIIITLSIPSLQKMAQNNKITSLYNECLAALNFARSTAITRGTNITLCHSNTARTECIDPDPSWENGWIIFPDDNSNGEVDATETVLSTLDKLPSGINVISTKSKIVYSSQGYALGYAGKITFCDAHGVSEKSGMVISANGRVRLATSQDTLAICP